jgi:hypothetical protein
VTRDGDTFLLRENESTFIPLGAVHRLENPGKTELELIEVQSGSYLGEDDIVRVEDVYGREKMDQAANASRRSARYEASERARRTSDLAAKNRATGFRCVPRHQVIRLMSGSRGAGYPDPVPVAGGYAICRAMCRQLCAGRRPSLAPDIGGA